MNENTNTSVNQAGPKTFDIIGGNTLMAQEYEPLQFAVDKILPHGLFILAGSGKIGKSSVTPFVPYLPLPLIPLRIVIGF